MNVSEGPQYSCVEQPFGVQPPIVFCPICGNQTNTYEGHDPCKHVAFIYGGSLSDFFHESDDFVNRTKRLDKGLLSFDNFDRFLEQAGYDNKLLALEITYGGGPTWYTDVYAFDYGTLVDEAA